MNNLLGRPLSALAVTVAAIAATSYGVAHFPRSIVVFMLFQASILLLYFANIPGRLKTLMAVATLGVLMPVLGSINGYYLEIAIQVGIFVALALGLNIVVGLAGLLDLGYVAFFAVGAYSWAVFGSPQANQIAGAHSSRCRPRGSSCSCWSASAWPRAPASCWACPCSASTATTWRSSRWASAR